MVLYENLTQINASGGFLTFTQGVNTVLMSGWLGALMLIGILAIIFTSTIFTTNDPKKSMLITSLSSLLLSIPLVGLDLLHPFAIYLSVIVWVLILAFTRNKD